MPHDAGDQVHWHEPRRDQMAGDGSFLREPSPYDRFMEAEGVPVHRAIAIPRVQDVEMQPWRRLGGRGAYIQMRGTESLWGLYVIEVPAGGALEIEQHLFEKTVLVIEGRGSTEVWRAGEARPRSFEWQPFSLFAIPLNARHRFVNARNVPALLLCGTTAPNMLNLTASAHFVFNCPYDFTESYAGETGYFRGRDEIGPDRLRGLALRRTNYQADVVHCELPLDNRRSPGYRRIGIEFATSPFDLWIGEHQPGRYGRALRQQPGGVLVCLSGHGYSHLWPDSLGTTPWADGQGAKVLRHEFGPVGLVSMAPQAGVFHQYFGTGPAPLRVMGWYGAGNHPTRRPGLPGERVVDPSALTVDKGGSAIGYEAEDPFVRADFAAAQAAAGGASRMPDALYARPAG